MTQIHDWFQRLNGLNADGGDAVHQVVFRVLSTSPLDVNHSIVRVDPTGRSAEAFGSVPGALGILHLLDAGEGPSNVRRDQALATQLGAVITLALGRRMRVAADEISIKPEDTDYVTFMPSGLTGRDLLGPIEGSPKLLIEKLLTEIAGLGSADATPILAACELHYAATQLYDIDLHTAFALVVAGLETLAGQFETHPTTWETFLAADHWDEVFTRLGLDATQADGVRDELLADRHFRLRQRFADYALRILTPGFWRHAVREFIPSFTSEPSAATFDGMQETGRPAPMETLVPKDRAVLRRRLLASYDARSKFVHAGTKDIDPDGSAFARTGGLVKNTDPLEFNGLRRILEWALRAEISRRSRSGTLPDCRLFRS